MSEKPKTTVKKSMMLALGYATATVDLVEIEGAPHRPGPGSYYRVRSTLPDLMSPGDALSVFRLAAAMLEDAEEYERRMRPPTMKELRDRL